MSGFLPPVVMEMRANASQFLSEQGKVIASAKTTATETEKAAQKEAAAARSSAAEATRAAEQKTLAADSAAKAAVVATDKRVAAEAKATEAQTKAAQMQADSLGAMTREQQAAYDEQVAAAERAANSVALAASKESEAQGKAAAAATASADAQSKAADMQKVAAEKSAAAQEVAATRTNVAMNSVMGVANKVAAVSILAAGAIAVGSVEMASKFEKSTMLLVTAGGESVNALASVRQGILDVSTQTGTSAEQMSEGMYVMEKAGIRGAAGLSALKMAAEGAKDENVDLSIMTQALTDLLLDYHTKTSDAAAVTADSVKYTNELVAASGAAKTTMTDFAGSMSAIIPIASASNISFVQVGAAIATMTQHGQTAQQSSQNLANLVMSLVRPNNLASAAMTQLGIDTTDLAQHLGDRGLSGTLNIVDKAIKDHTQNGLVFTGTMKDNANATKAMDTIMSQMSPTLAGLSKGLKDGSVTQKEYTKTVKDLGGEAGALGNQFMTLYKANSGVTDSLKAGKPAYETYTAALRDVLGNVTAMRAAQMLLMNDSHEFEANIKAIGEAGKKTGQDISTWADMQSTLSVKMDQTKAMVENLGIEMGSKLLPAAKDLVGGFTDLFHGMEQGNPVLWGAVYALEAITAIAVAGKIVGGLKSISKSTLQMATDVKSSTGSFITGFRSAEGAMDSATGKMGSFGGAVSRALPTMGKLATGAGIAAAAFKGLAAAQEAFGTNGAAPSIDQTTNSMLKLNDATNGADDLFQKWDSGPLTTAPSDVHNLSDAIGYMNDGWAKSGDAINKVVGFLPGLIGVKTTDGMDQVNSRIGTMGQSLGQMVSSGSISNAARDFDEMAKQQVKAGGSTQDLLDKMPAYRDALIQQATAAHQTLSQQELMEYAMGRVPQKMQAAASATGGFTDAIGQIHPITPDLQKSLDDAGVSADGLATDLSKVLDGMLAAGLATENSRTATEGFNKTINDAQTAVDDLKKQHVDLSNALNGTATDFNLADTAGAQLNDKFTAIKDKGIEVAKSLAGQGKDAVSGALVDTYNNMIKGAEGMGIHGQAAIDLTRNLLGIPKNVDVKTWVDTAAAQAATDKLQGSLDKLPTYKSVAVNVQYTESGTQVLKDAQSAGNTLTTKISNMGGAVSETMGFWDGGVIPGTPPSNPRMDNILTMVDGKPLKVRSGEFITNEPMTKVNMPWLKASNAGLNIGSAMANRYASGYAQGASQAAPQHVMAGQSSASNITNNVSVQTNASPDQIAKAISWEMRTK